MWMGADPVAIVAALGEAIYHVHAKDARIEPNAATRTVLETMSLFTDTPGVGLELRHSGRTNITRIATTPTSPHPPLTDVRAA